MATLLTYGRPVTQASPPSSTSRLPRRVVDSRPGSAARCSPSAAERIRADLAPIISAEALVLCYRQEAVLTPEIIAAYDQRWRELTRESPTAS